MTNPSQRLIELLEQEPHVQALAQALARGDADDVAQDVWLRAIEDETRGVRKPRAWLSSIVRNVAHKFRRAQRRRTRHERLAAREGVVPSSAELMEREECRRELVAAVDALPGEQRAVVLLRYFESLPPQAIARKLDLPVTTVWNRLRTALASLRQRLDDRYGDRRGWLLPLLPEGSGHAAREVAPWLAVFSGLTAKVTGTAAGAAAVLAILLWSAGVFSPAPPTGSLEPGSVPPLVADLPVEEERGDDGAALARRTAVDTPGPRATTGQLVVHTMFHNGELPVDLGVIVLRVGGHHSVGLRRARTGSDGIARIDDLVPGEYRVRSGRNKLNGELVPATIRAGEETEVELAIRAGARLHGVVVDRNGASIAGAIVAWASGGTLDESETIAVTGSDGRFDVRGSSPAGTIQARAAGYAPSRTQAVHVEVGGEAELRLEFTEPGGTVAGTVLGPGGQPVAHAVVRIGKPDPIGRIFDGTEARTGRDGRFSAVGIPEGDQPVTVRAPNCAPWTGRCFVAPFREATLQIDLTAGTTCRGRVIGPDGRPLSNADVEVGELYVFPYDRRNTGDDGAFHFDGLAPGVIELRVSHKTGAATYIVRGAPGETIECEIRLDGGLQLRGQLLTSGGEPVAGAMVSASAEATAGAESWGRARFTDADGVFTIANCPGDRKLTVVARKHGVLTQRVDGVDPRAGELVVRMEPAPPATVRIRGQVVGPEGKPVPSTVFAQARLGESSGVQPTAGDGGFELGPIAPGLWQVSVRSQGHPTHWTGWHELTDHEAWDLGRIALPAGGRVRVRFPGDGGFSGSAILCDRSFRQFTWVYQERNLLPSVAPGTHVLVLRGEGVALQALPVEVRAGEETVIDLRPQRGFSRRLVFRAPSPLNELRFEIFSGPEMLYGSTLYRRRDAPIRMEQEVWLAAGEYTVVSHGDGLEARVPFTVSADAGEDVPVSLR